MLLIINCFFFPILTVWEGGGWGLNVSSTKNFFCSSLQQETKNKNVNLIKLTLMISILISHERKTKR